MYSVVDLFAGAGGLSLGFTQTGHFKVVGVIENNESAIETYKRNHQGEKIKFDKDIRKINFVVYKEEIGEVDVVIGGPPCQGFSNANRQKTKFISMNNSLVKRYVDAVLAIKPKAFVMENVAMLRSDVHKFFDSEIDHDEVVALNIQKKKETFVIMNNNPDGFEMVDYLQNKEWVSSSLINEVVFNGIKLIRRYTEKKGKLQNYYKKYSSQIINHLKEYKKQFKADKIGIIILDYIDKIIDIYANKVIENIDTTILEKFIEFTRAISLMQELYDNKILFSLESEDGGKIVAKIETYTVYEYLRARISQEYRIQDGVLNACDFGAPQERRRFIMLGVRKDYNNGEEISLPIVSSDKTIHTVRDAIGDLEKIVPGKLVSEKPIKRKSFSANSFTRELQGNCDEIHNHVNTDTRETALERFRNIDEGKNFHSLSQELKENTYSDPNRTQNTIYLRLKYDDPCGTVVNVRKSMWIHPVLDRAISIREAARLQTFPDSYIFCGSKDSQYQQVGNAVPPILARIIAEQLLKFMED